ncbi:T9SS type A sorting domain-containing protein, partial [bacterium]|nr:T9SS type A sorting domain-containing protein [bacterium]
QIWFTNEFHYHTLRATDQRDLISWLTQAGEGKERNLLLTGNYIGYELIEVGRETLGFYTDWLATEYVQNRPGTHADTMPIVRDAAGDFDFMTFDNRFCHLWDDGCFHASSFDVVQPDSAAEGAELVAEYLTTDMTAWPAGVAYTDTALGYQTVNLGFGIEFMVGELGRGVHYGSGAPDRVDLMANIMEYFGKTPTGPGTGTDDGAILVNKLDYACPNPFNPVTTIDFSLAVDGRATIRVFNAAGRVVRTLVDRDVEAGEHRAVWDGTTDAGQRAASGVYFLRMETAGHTDPFRATRKLVLLK